MVSIRKASPILLDCDTAVSRFLSFFNSKEDAILICLKEKEKEKDIDIEMVTRLGGSWEEEVGLVQEMYESQENYEVVNGTETRETSVQIIVDEEINVDVDENVMEEMLDRIRESTETCVGDSCLNTGCDCMEANELFSESDPLLLTLGEDVVLENVDVNAREPPNGVVPSNVVVRPRVVRRNVERRNGCSGVVVCIPENEDFHVNKIFKLKSHLLFKLQKLATKYKFEYKTQTSNKSVLSVLCKEDGCKWRLRATKIDEGYVRGVSNPRFMVRTYATKHSCQPIAPKKDHRHNSYKLVGKRFARRFKGANRVNPPRELMSDYHEKTGYEIAYGKANKARRYAESLIRGDPTKSFGELPKYWYKLKLRNPGPVTHIETDENDLFRYSFMALGQSIEGFKSAMRKVISVDGTHLNHIIKGYCLWQYVKMEIINCFHLLLVLLIKKRQNLGHGFLKS